MSSLSIVMAPDDRAAEKEETRTAKLHLQFGTGL